jgi:hypothetical protein
MNFIYPVGELVSKIEEYSYASDNFTTPITCEGSSEEERLFHSSITQ